MEHHHVGFFPSFFATLGFMIPMFYFYAMKFDFAMLAWAGVIIYLLINGFSNKRWASELDRKAWNSLYRDSYQKIFKLRNQKGKDEA
jgi:hypothetical protein